MNDRSRLQRALGYRFEDEELLNLALTHRSVGGQNNERLEFLGDSVINHLIAEEIYRRFPGAREGQMSRMRASLVKGETLAEVAKELQLGEQLQLGRGERKSGGHRRTSILADALEAVIGAILLDSDIDTCRRSVLDWFGPRLDELSPVDASKDPKTRLQEYLQGRNSPLPTYKLLQVDGDDHAQLFHVACCVTKPSIETRGSGPSRRRAEQEAATQALDALDLRNGIA